MEIMIGRMLLALLFFSGAMQKILNPAPAGDLLAGFGMPEFLVWPAMVFNLAAALCLIANRFIVPVARALAAYCILTSAFHFIPADPWQISIFIKNWAIAGGLLVLAGSETRT